MARPMTDLEVRVRDKYDIHPDEPPRSIAERAVLDLLAHGNQLSINNDELRKECLAMKTRISSLERELGASNAALQVSDRALFAYDGFCDGEPVVIDHESGLDTRPAVNAAWAREVARIAPSSAAVPSSASKAALPGEVAEVLKSVRAFAKLSDDALPSSDYEWGNKEFLQTACRTSRSLIRTTVSRIDELDMLLSALASKAQTAEARVAELESVSVWHGLRGFTRGDSNAPFTDADLKTIKLLLMPFLLNDDKKSDRALFISRLCSTVEAVAAKSREEALSEVEKAIAATPIDLGDWGLGEIERISVPEFKANALRAVRALKSSRADSGQSPATMLDAPLDET